MADIRRELANHPVTFIAILCASISFNAYLLLKTESKQTVSIEQDTVIPQSKEKSFPQEYVTNLPLEYFDGNVATDKEGAYIESMGFQGEIVPVKDGEGIKFTNVDEPFEGLDSVATEDPARKPYWGDPLDVDLDGTNEQVFFYSLATNHTPHVAAIVKNGRVIFRAEGPGISLIKAGNGNGFYTEEYQWDDVPTANTKTTRYVYKNNEFTPVWYRKTYVLKVEGTK